MKIVLTSSLLLATLVTTPTDAAFPPHVTALMDTSIDPCEDFYQYSCGGWLKNFTIPADTDNYNYAFEAVIKRTTDAVQDILKENKPIVGEFYNSCMALSTLTAMGNTPLRSAFATINAAHTKYELVKTVGNLSFTAPSLIIGWNVMADPQDATTNVFSVGYAYTILDLSYYAPDQFSSIEAPYRKYISKLVKLAGINANTTSQQGKNGPTPAEIKYAEDVVIKIEKQVAAIQPTDEENQGSYSIKYSEGLTKWPLTFGAMVQGLDVLNHSALTANSKVSIAPPAFMDRVEKLFNSLELKDLKIYYQFVYTDFYATSLGEPFIQASFDFYNKALEGATVHAPRKLQCTQRVKDFLSVVLGEYFFQKMFDASREQDVMTMANFIKQAMGQHLAQLTWMDEPTRQAAFKKLWMIVTLIGHPTSPENYPYVLSRDNYFANVQTIRTKWSHDALAKINKRVDRTAWPQDLSAAAFLVEDVPQLNQMVFPAGFLQSPFYTQNSLAHPVQNFGAIGVTIAQTLIYHFDNYGRYNDAVGNPVDWWSSTTAAAYDDRAMCLVDEYNQFVAYGDSGQPVGHVNGSLTRTQNVDYNGAVNVAFEAYHNWVKSGVKFNPKGVQDNEVDKLFFVSFAQMGCEKIRDDEQKQLLQTYSVSPGSANTNGAVMNSEYFAKAFQCKVGSKMNPEKKCKVF